MENQAKGKTKAAKGVSTKGQAKDGGSTFGQEQPPLYIYIKRILERYPGGQIFKVRYRLIYRPLKYFR